MRAVWLEVPEAFLEERRRLGHDKKDELWDGVLHMVPTGSFSHALVINRLDRLLATIAERRGMQSMNSELSVFDRDDNYRVPDVVLFRPQHETDRGLVGASLVVEILSPNDESREKQPFYAAMRIPESWIIDPITRAHEVYELRRGRYVRVDAIDGVTRSPLLGVTLATCTTSDGPRLRVTDGDHVGDV